MDKNRIDEVYEKYKHLDGCINDENWRKSDIFYAQILYDLWQAIKSYINSNKIKVGDSILNNCVEIAIDDTGGTTYGLYCPNSYDCKNCHVHWKKLCRGNKDNIIEKATLSDRVDLILRMISGFINNTNEYCEWKIVDNGGHCKIGCRDGYWKHEEQYFTFCPHCGKRIKKIKKG